MKNYIVKATIIAEAELIIINADSKEDAKEKALQLGLFEERLQDSFDNTEAKINVTVRK